LTVLIEWLSRQAPNYHHPINLQEWLANPRQRIVRASRNEIERILWDGALAATNEALRKKAYKSDVRKGFTPQ
jgi:hypothetical protein